MKRSHFVFSLVPILFLSALTCAADDPTAQDLIDRRAKEKTPVWTDGDKATFFFQGDAEQVTLIVGGESKQLRRLLDSDVWTLTIDRPGLEKGVFSYALTPGKKGEPAFKPGQALNFEKWRGPKAPPAPAGAKELKGTEKTLDIESKILNEKRKIKIYLPPGHDPTKSYPVVYAADGMTNGDIVEPLILVGKLPPMIVVGVSSGSYRGDRGKPYKIKEDLRACEYLPGVDDGRFAKHEKFFTEEVRAWAEKELGASGDRKERAVYGVSNGGRFSAEMGLRHPELFGHVYAFSVAGIRSSEPKAKAADLPYFHLAAGTWEKSFHKITLGVADKLKELNVPVVFVSRVAGHDDAMWRDEFAAALIRAFGKDTASREVPLSLLGSWQNQDEEKEVIHFEPAKSISVRVGQPESLKIKRVSWEPGELTFRYWASKKVYGYELKDRALSLRELPDGKMTRYRRMDKAPVDVQLKPLTLSSSKDIPEDQVASIREELARRGKIDQEVRTNKDKMKDMPKVDADNTKYLIKLIGDVGWIDVERFGAKTAHHAFLIVQHSGHIPLMLAALPPIEKDVKAKQLDAQPYALLYDRLQVNLGEKQRYGSQLGTNDSGELVLMPLEDAGRVEEIRKEIGLFPLSKYLKFFEKQNGGKPVKVAEDD
ncbi:MAG: hypothetical protein HY040_14180 [Planctomycetes bacterium]|nr:hypothetical protein [Planctomycetota bacterium]